MAPLYVFVPAHSIMYKFCLISSGRKKRVKRGRSPGLEAAFLSREYLGYATVSQQLKLELFHEGAVA